jgi:hypothetical protein
MSGAGDSNGDVLQELIRDCSPATFDKGEQDVLDSTYRKAGKMDPESFATTFDPDHFGILENVEQILLPSVKNDEKSKPHLRKLSATLYKLNVWPNADALGAANIWAGVLRPIWFVPGARRHSTLRKPDWFSGCVPSIPLRRRQPTCTPPRPRDRLRLELQQ